MASHWYQETSGQLVLFLFQMWHFSIGILKEITNLYEHLPATFTIEGGRPCKWLIFNCLDTAVKTEDKRPQSSQSAALSEELTQVNLQ